MLTSDCDAASRVFASPSSATRPAIWSRRFESRVISLGSPTTAGAPMKRRSCSIPYACERLSSRCSKSAIAHSISACFRFCLSASSLMIVRSWVSMAYAASLYGNEPSGGAPCPACAAGGGFFSSAMIWGTSAWTIACRVSGGTLASVSTMIWMPIRRPARGFIRINESAASTRRAGVVLVVKQNRAGACPARGRCSPNGGRRPRRPDTRLRRRQARRRQPTTLLCRRNARGALIPGCPGHELPGGRRW